MNKIIPFLVIIILTYSQQPLKIDIPQSQIVNIDNLFRIQLAVTGGIPPYTYTYPQIPSNWINIGEYIFLQNTEASQKKKFVLRSRIKDNNFEQVSGTIVLVSDGKTLSFDQILYSFQQRFPPAFFIVQEQSQSSIQDSSSSDQSNSLNIVSFTDRQQLIQNLRNTQVRLNQTIDPIFSLLPSLGQLDSAITNGNITQLLSVIQTVKNLFIGGCPQKSSYLQQIVSRVQSAIELKQYDIDKLEVVNFAAEKELQSLNQLKDQLTQRKDALDLSLLLGQLQEKKKELQKIQTLQQTLDGQIQSQQFVIAQHKFMLAIYNNQNEQLKARLRQINVQLTSLLTTPQLAQLSVQISTIQQQIQELDSKILQSTVAIDQKEDNLKDLKELKNKMNLIQAKAFNQNLQIAENVQQNQAKVNAIENDLQLTNFQIFQQQQNLRTMDIAMQTLTLNNFKQVRDTIQPVIDSYTFACLGVQAQVNFQEQTATLSFSQFFNYFQSVFPISQFNGSISAQVTLNNIRILSQAYEKLYGPAFTTNALSLSQGNKFVNDFICLAPSKLEKIQGTVLKLENNLLHVQTNLGKISLIIGTCTKIQSTKAVPNVGDIVYAQGVQLVDGFYDAYIILVV